MEETTKIIAVVWGASNIEIQAIFRALADKWQPDVRLVGLVRRTTGSLIGIDLSRSRPRRGYVSP
jgi:hypothetical protein